MEETIHLVEEPEKNRVALYDGTKEIGECTFVRNRTYWTLDHTEVNPAYGGKGLAGALVRKVADMARTWGSYPFVNMRRPCFSGKKKNLQMCGCGNKSKYRENSKTAVVQTAVVFCCHFWEKGNVAEILLL